MVKRIDQEASALAKRSVEEFAKHDKNKIDLEVVVLAKRLVEEDVAKNGKTTTDQ